ncbi:MAG: HEAT repeat domain-containing protein [Planctomycetota bacterium]|jgi:HEAT repeat protein
MKGPQKAALAAVVLAVGVLVVLLAILTGRPPENERETVPPARPAGSDPAETPSPSPDTRTLPDLLAEIRAASNLEALATELRAEAVADREFLRALIALLSDGTADARSRQVAAIVLGTIDDREAQDALLAALKAGGDAAWIRTLILALGSNRERPTPFDVGDKGPFVVQHEETGLCFRVRDPDLDESVIDAVLPHLGHADRDVRYAAERALRNVIWLTPDRPVPDAPTPGMEKVRAAFVDALREDPDETMKAAFAHQLAEWTAFFPDADTVAAVVDAAMQEEAGTVRFRTKEPLGRTDIPAEQWRILLDAALKESFDTRTWAIEVVASRVGRLPEEHRDAFRHVFELGIRDSDPKVRQYAARDLAKARIPGGEQLLLETLQDAEWNVRVASAKALEDYPATDEVVGKLEQASRSDPSEHVRKAAEKTLLWFRKRPEPRGR